MAAPQVATGTTIVFGTSAFAATIMGGNLGAARREKVRTTALAATQPTTNQEGGHTYIPGKLHDLEDLDLEIQWNPATGSRVPLHAAAETITITFPDGATLAGTGFIYERGPVALGVDGLVQCTIKVCRSGIWS